MKFIILLLFLVSCIHAPTMSISNVHESKEETSSNAMPILIGIGAGSLLIGISAASIEEQASMEMALMFSGIGLGLWITAGIVYLAE